MGYTVDNVFVYLQMWPSRPVSCLPKMEAWFSFLVEESGTTRPAGSVFFFKDDAHVCLFHS